jgi:hypothetical protein
VNEYIQKYFNSTKFDSYINDERKRYGLMYYNDNGELYFGDWLGNQWHGKGVHYDSDFSTYEGDFLDDWMHGKSIIYFWLNDKVSFEGDIIKGKKNGKGIHYLPENQKYEGDFLNDKMHGIGLVSESNGKKVFYGEFKNGEPVRKYH